MMEMRDSRATASPSDRLVVVASRYDVLRPRARIGNERLGGWRSSLLEGIHHPSIYGNIRRSAAKSPRFSEAFRRAPLPSFEVACAGVGNGEIESYLYVP
ncbi:hypothetical protein MRX96_029317 [Rhipicephalus microplus]